MPSSQDHFNDAKNIIYELEAKDEEVAAIKQKLIEAESLVKSLSV